MFFGLLLAVCAVTARILLWVHARDRVVSSGIYYLFLAVALFSAFSGILFNLIKIRNIDHQLEVSWSLGILYYFTWGIEGVILICGIIFLVLILIHKKAKSELVSTC